MGTMPASLKGQQFLCVNLKGHTTVREYPVSVLAQRTSAHNTHSVDPMDGIKTSQSCQTTEAVLRDGCL